MYTKAGIGLFILVLLGGAWYLYPWSSVEVEMYTNEKHKFSFTAPDGYEVQEVDDMVAVVNTSGDGIQILMTPIDEDIPIMTTERIHEDIPDLTIADTEPVEIGTDRTGLAFKSDNEAFDGASREVWFVYNGYLYQISTYERLDPILKQLFSTWTFL